MYSGSSVVSGFATAVPSAMKTDKLRYTWILFKHILIGSVVGEWSCASCIENPQQPPGFEAVHSLCYCHLSFLNRTAISGSGASSTVFLTSF